MWQNDIPKYERIKLFWNGDHPFTRVQFKNEKGCMNCLFLVLREKLI